MSDPDVTFAAIAVGACLGLAIAEWRKRPARQALDLIASRHGLPPGMDGEAIAFHLQRSGTLYTRTSMLMAVDLLLRRELSLFAPLLRPHATLEEGRGAITLTLHGAWLLTPGARVRIEARIRRYMLPAGMGLFVQVPPPAFWLRLRGWFARFSPSTEAIP